MGTFRRHNVFILFLLIMPYKVSCSKIIQGDILVSTGTNSKSDPSMASGVQLADPSKFWPQGKVYYRFEPSFQNTRNKKQIRDMMDYITTKLNDCITFHEVSNSYSDHVLITNRGCEKQPGNRCYATVGRKGGMQCLNLDQKCMSNGTIVHELLHTMGFEHEDLRPDRDQFPIIPSWPMYEEPLTAIDTVDIALAYSCPLDQQQMIDYVHSNRISSAQQLSGLERKVKILENSLIDMSNNNNVLLDRKVNTLENSLIDLSNNNKVLLEGKIKNLENSLIGLSNNNKVLLEGKMKTLEKSLTGLSNNNKDLLEGKVKTLEKSMIDLTKKNKVLLEGKMKTLETSMIDLSNNNKDMLEGKVKTLEKSLIDLSNNNKVFQPALNPDIVTVSSDKGPASHAQYPRMGVFTQSGDFNGHPMWTGHDDTEKIFYSTGGYWLIGADPGSNEGGIGSVKKGLAVLPVTGWEYSEDGTWTGDTELTVMAGQPVYPQSIQVSSTGPAVDVHPDCLGQYHKIEGQQQNGRPLWKHSERDYRILYYSDSGYWTIGKDPNTTSGWIKSVKKGLMNIPETGWEFADGPGPWGQDDQLKFL